MSAREGRAASPPARASTTNGDQSDTPSAPEPKTEKFQAPPRPAGLRGSVLGLYGLILVTLILFALVAETLKHPVPSGKFEKKDGTLIDLAAFDPVELGPYPKCHPNHKQYLVNNESGIQIWALIDAAPKDQPFPPGHPENEAWKEKWDARVKKESAKNRYTWKGIQPSLHLFALATLTVLLGSKHSVWIFAAGEENGDEIAHKTDAAQMIQTSDAYWFPVVGSGALFTLFVVYKYLGSEWIKYAFSCYVVCMCGAGLGANFGQFGTVLRGKATKPLFVVPISGVEVTAFSLIGVFCGMCMTVVYMTTQNWIVNNMFGVSFCLLGIKKIGTPNFKAGAIMLIGLFFYDIFWVFGSKAVFGSNVMVTVAKGVEAPIKLMFPRSQDGCGNLEFQMLGLGDIVVPGIYIAFLAKWDAVLQGQSKASSFTYLNATMVAYVLSLVVTVGVMLIFNAAQPALLYIVPLVMITSVGLALVRGELKDLLAFEIPDGEENPAAEAQDSAAKEAAAKKEE